MSSAIQSENFNDIFDGFTYDKSNIKADATKILIIRANYYKEIAYELTCGTILQIAQDDNSCKMEILKDIKRCFVSDNIKKNDMQYDEKLLQDNLSSIVNINMTFATTHGCLELPQIANRFKNDYDIIMFVGCVIRGETTHYETVCGETNRAIMDISLTSKAVVVNAILNVENYEQAANRSGFWLINHQNKGGGAIKAAFKTLAEIKKLKDLNK